MRWFCYCSSGRYFTFFLCLKCAMFRLQSSENRSFDHPSHTQHPLTLIQRPSPFKCDACNVEDNNKDLSYICTKCPFWMHKSCADAPMSFQFHFHHKHPLTLSFSLPKAYRKFDQYCKLCNETLNRLKWLYYCGRCRFFAHFECARSSQMLRPTEYENLDSELVHLPAADKSCIDLLVEQFIKATLINNSNNNYDSLFSTTNGNKHWSHDEHNLQLMTTDELNDHRYDDEIILICDGCVRAIQPGDHFYSCSVCKYFLHKACAEFPRQIEHHPWAGQTLSAVKYRVPYMFFQCDGCGESCNGIFFGNERPYIQLHIGCATLPATIKHEAHPHKLNQVYVEGYSKYDPRHKFSYYLLCRACGRNISRCKYRCEECDYNICGKCVMKPKTSKHPWDPHPLHLIYEPGMVMEDHEHDFNCEFCSEDIDTNLWFYNCGDCDLSFHLDCSEESRFSNYSNVKFGTNGILIDKLHPHSLIFILNKKVRNCEKCHRDQLGRPVLECAVASCKVILCRGCSTLAINIKFYSKII